MKRLTFLSLLLLATVMGCSKSENQNLRTVQDTPPPRPTPAADTEPVKENYTFAFVTNQIADFWKLAESGAKSMEGDSYGMMTVEVRMPSQATADMQKRIVEDLLTSGVDGIAISPVDPENQTDWLNSIAEKVPLITHDSDAPTSNRLMYIGMDNYAAGRDCGKLVKSALPEGGEVLLFIGRLEQDNSKFRRQGVIDELLDRDRDQEYYRSQPDAWDPADEVVKNDKYTVLGTITDTGKPEIAQSKAEDALNSYPELDGMVGLFEYNPPACFQALQKAGKLGEVKLIGFDENEVTLQAIKDGHCEGTVVQNPWQYGYDSMRVLYEHMTLPGGAIPESKYLDIPARTITADNVDRFRAELQSRRGE